MRKVLFLAGLGLLLASPALAQTAVTVINPNFVEFDSPDHDKVIGTIPAVDHYALKIVAATATGTVLSVVQLGKPAAVNGHVGPISIGGDIQALANNVYQATVSVYGPDGSEAVSPLTDPFGRVGTPAAPSKPVLLKK